MVSLAEMIADIPIALTKFDGLENDHKDSDALQDYVKISVATLILSESVSDTKLKEMYACIVNLYAAPAGFATGSGTY